MSRTWGPVQVLLFVEAGSHFHQARHLLARLRGPDQAIDERRIGADAIDRHLDGQDLGVVASGADETGRGRIETLVGMVDDDVARAEDGKNAAVTVRKSGRGNRLPGLIAEIRARQRRYRK